ncbi:MAG: fructosamine kinase family protein [Ectothiorhodospiraceae bacterium]|nr:fructosamine kinase family protein [Ectothiorhodospiraceae bacterium]MBN4053099.1 fructosamine kinase family protein [Gammaproteobacteria bacterium AH-315-K14]
MPDWGLITAQVKADAGLSLEANSARPVGGGCISSAFVLTSVSNGTSSNEAYFIKTHQAAGLGMFEAERDGLLELAKSSCLRVPAPVCSGVAQDAAYLLMEYIPLNGTGDDALLGEALAAMHQQRHQQRQQKFGWKRDNNIGSTPQMNALCDNWPQFWSEQRLAFQLRLAAKNGAGQAFLARAKQLQAVIPEFFSHYQPAASLLHGDLWSGNAAFDQHAQPVIFDPAVYYGDRETDLAMTELFGGFSQRFYSAYNSVWALDSGYSTRKILYNLYHILNHFNLFGGGYLSQAEGMVDRLLSEMS